MTCGLFLILHHVLCVLAIDPGTSTVSTETPILTGSGLVNNLCLVKILMLKFVMSHSLKCRLWYGHESWSIIYP